MKLVILSSSFIDSSLKAEFGEILPIELPIYNKELLTHQLTSVGNLKLNREDIYITVPKGYKYSNPQNVNIIEFNAEFSLFEVLKGLSKFFDDNEKIFFYYGDTLLSEIDFEKIEFCKNYFFVGNTNFNYNWGIHSNGMVPAGGIVSFNYNLKQLINQSSSFDELTSLIFNDSSFQIFSGFKWLDFGHNFTFYYSRKNFLESRSFNQIEICDNFLIKSSEDIFKIWVEYKWLNEQKKHLPNNIPYVKDFLIKNDRGYYFIEYLNFPVLSDIFVFGKLESEYFLKILFSLKKNLKSLHSFVKIYKSNFLTDKLLERKEGIFQAVEKLSLDSKVFNDLFYQNVEYFENKEMSHGVIHGDYCFSNILFNFSSFEPILIDPRGYLSRVNGYSTLGPCNYDLYKLAHSFVGGYDYIISGKEDIVFNKFENIKIRLANFCEIFEIGELEVKMGMINLFLSMIPLHSNSPKRQKAFLILLENINKI